MRDVLIAIIIIGSVLTLCAWAPTIPTEYAPGPIAQRPDWPQGLADVLNSRERVYGYWNGSSENHVYYSGSPAEFEAFVRGLRALDGTSVAVILHSGTGLTTEVGGNRQIPFDWEIVTERGHSDKASHAHIEVHLWTGGDTPPAS